MVYRLVFLLLIVSSLQTLSAQSIRDFSLENIDGQWESYEELKGEQLTVIDFWASWCKPCMKAMPKIDDIYQQLKEDGLSVISINTDGPRSISKVTPLSRTLNLSYPILSDINSEITQELEVVSMPTLLLINSDDEIVYRHEGWTNGDEVNLLEVIQKHLK